MAPETPGLESLIQRVERLETLEKKGRRMRLAWYLGATIVLFMLIYVLADLGSGLVKALDRLDRLEAHTGQQSSRLEGPRLPRA